MAVAEPNPAIAFALPVVGPSKLVDPKRAVPTKAPSGPTPNLAGNTVRHLTFGRGEGAQPSPEYPPEAARAGEVGVVSVRFAVAENGNVVSAEIVTPCRSPILNQAALRTIRDRWHFPPGEKRLYEISINFQLDKQ
jgi:protein TonB